MTCHRRRLGPGFKVTSITDRDLQGRQSFAEKDAEGGSGVGLPHDRASPQDRIVLVPPGSDEQAPWVAALSGHSFSWSVSRRWKTG